MPHFLTLGNFSSIKHAWKGLASKHLDYGHRLRDSQMKQETKARRWFNELEHLENIKIPRCLQPVDREGKSTSLHTFVDASSNAYGTVVLKI